MELGKHLRELFRLRLAVVICFALASFAALTMTYKVSLMPPRLEPRALEIASAKTEVLVDTPKSTVLDLGQGASEFAGMTNRAVLIGNVMVSAPVLAYIARRAGVPAGVIRAQAPLTPDFPRPLSGVDEQKRTSDLVRSTDQYRLNIQTNPTVPILEIFAQAPSAEAASTLANAAVDGLRDYLQAKARSQGTTDSDTVRLAQLGRASGVVINGGVRPQLAILSFLIVFALSSATAMFVARVRRGWELADGDEDGPREPPLQARRPADGNGSSAGGADLAMR
ncbi:MAG: hypothetical protein ACR2H2_07645 [Solirubrobacteraceae bacterium]